MSLVDLYWGSEASTVDLKMQISLMLLTQSWNLMGIFAVMQVESAWLSSDYADLVGSFPTLNTDRGTAVMTPPLGLRW